MRGTRQIILGAITILSFMSGIFPVFANEPDIKKSYGHHQNSKGNNDDTYDHHTNRTHVMRIDDNDRAALRRYAENHYKKYCPPGLAKKRGECLQYGQPHKRYVVGYNLPENILYYPVPRDVVVHLSPVPTGYRYVRVDNDVLLMDVTTRQIIDAVTMLASHPQ